jgi:hypothetical protein
MIPDYLLIFASDAHVIITQASCRIVSGSIFSFLKRDAANTSISAAVLQVLSKIFWSHIKEISACFTAFNLKRHSYRYITT